MTMGSTLNFWRRYLSSSVDSSVDREPEELEGSGKRVPLISTCPSSGGNFYFMPGLLSQTALTVLAHFVTKLSDGPASGSFIKLTKNLRSIKTCSGKFEFLSQHFDNLLLSLDQAEQYNHFGGVARHCGLIPEELINTVLRKTIQYFIDTLDLPDGTVVLLQIQRTEVKPGFDARWSSMLGKGIHTDGHEQAMMVCIERENIEGALNTFHGRLDGSKPLCKPVILLPGDAVFFKDDRCYHHVSPTTAADATKEAYRTVLSMHSLPRLM